MVVQFSLPLVIVILGLAVVVGGAILLASSVTASVAGIWVGNVVMKDVGAPHCSFEGPASLTLTQSGANIAGWLNGSIAITTPSPEGLNCSYTGPFYFTVRGVVNGMKIALLDNYNINYTGGINSDIMILQVDTFNNKTNAQTGKACVEYCGYAQIFT